MPLETLALLAPTFLVGAAAFSLSRREEVDLRARFHLAAPAALAGIALVVQGIAAPPLEALARASEALAAPLALLVLALALSRMTSAGARAGALALALASIAYAGSPFLGAQWGRLVLALALTLAFALPSREPWARSAVESWSPALGALLVAPLAAATAPALAAAAVALVGLALAARASRQRALLGAMSLLGVLLGVAAALVSPAFAIVALVVLPVSLGAMSFLRARALGAASRPLAALAASYACATLAAALWDNEPLAVGVGFGVGALVLALLEVAAPSLDEARARRVVLARAQQDGARSPAGPIAPGERIVGRYRILERLGEGTFGTAFLASDEVGGERVVVKALRSGTGEDRRILREARAIATVRHPNVIELRDIVEDARGSFLVMEFADAGSLAQRLEKGRLEGDELRRVGLGVLDALAAVHEAGLIHRDVKPGNVLLTTRGAVKLADFGLARASDADATLAPGNLAPPVGTLRYMAPEVARGRAASVASDIYGAAATIYEALTGRPYVEAAPNESAVEIQMRVAAIGPFDAPLPAGMRAWFARALDPDPSGRFASAREARDAFLALAPTLA